MEIEIAEYYPKGFLARQGGSLGEVAERLRRVGRAFLAALEPWDDADFARPLAPGKWSPAQIADHLVRANQLFARAIEGAGTSGETLRMARGRVTEDGRAIAPEEQEPIPNRIRGDLAQDFGASLERLVEAAQRADPALACLEHAFFGEMTVLEVLQLAAWHVRHHTKQLPGSPPRAS